MCVNPIGERQGKRNPEEDRDVIAFVNVNVVPMDRDGIVPAQTVTVRGDRIAEIGPAGTTMAPEGAAVIDGRGKYLTPGLMDMHVHLENEDQLTLWVANGVTTVRQMWGTPEILELREKIKRGDVPGPRVFTAGPILNATGPSCTPVETPERAWEVVAENKASGYDFVKVYDGISKDVYDALIEAAREYQMPVIGHVPIAVGVEHALASRHHCIEHLTGYDLFLQREDSPLRGRINNPGRFQMWRYADESKIERIAEATRDAGTWNAVSLTVFKNKITREEMKEELKKPHMKYVSRRVKEGWFTRHGWVSRMSESVREDVKAGAGTRSKLIRALCDAGAGIVLGTDDPDPLLVSGFCVHQELENLFEAGMSPYEAIRAATYDAADCLGAAEELGAVSVSRRADLLLLEENPLADVGNAARRAGVMLRGRYLPESELRSMLDRLARKHARAKA